MWNATVVQKHHQTKDHNNNNNDNNCCCGTTLPFIFAFAHFRSFNLSGAELNLMRSGFFSSRVPWPNYARQIGLQSEEKN